jgi:hypothetical protein
LAIDYSRDILQAPQAFAPPAEQLMTFSWPHTTISEAPVDVDYQAVDTWHSGVQNTQGDEICDVIEGDHEVWEQDDDESAVPGLVLADDSSDDDQTDDDE